MAGKLQHSAADRTSMKGLVISRFGSEADIELPDGQILRCHLRRKLENIVCGDRVLCQNEGDHQGVVTKILPRESVLERPIRYQGLKAVAANLDQICIVVSPEPEFSSLILDKYLVAAEHAGINALIIFNKADLLPGYADIPQQLDVYRALDYTVLLTSVKKPEGLEALQQSLSNHSSVFVGQSGVGKSSLVNALLPEVQAQVSEISDNSGLGTHTTTASRLYHLPGHGILIDSPGIREFSLEHIDKKLLKQGYREIYRCSEFCKYRDCLHLQEPGCAVKKAVEENLIDKGRYARYIKILQQEDE
ncbi:MAG TPA: small ribosomal subunit biogenesis GTPase RsgA [Aeromonadales bacterium]|nr:small ribosomal subunit biogenesis GTPase RsgA [Aeromonadales bacterium]